MGSLSSRNKNINCLLCFIDVFTKNGWVKTLKEKKVKKVLNGFIIKIVNVSNCKPNE